MLTQFWRIVIARAIAQSNPGKRNGLLRYARNDVKIELTYHCNFFPVFSLFIRVKSKSPLENKIN